jgi:hypothetical protein
VPVLLVVPVLPDPASGLVLAPVVGGPDEAGTDNGSGPSWAVVRTRPSEPVGPPASRWADAGISTATADAAGAGPEAEEPPGSRGSRRIRTETADRIRKAIAPADISMTGAAVRAGRPRSAEPVRALVVLLQSASSAKASGSMGSDGP